jgi:deoxyribodipyrimidine photo-lyase
MLNECALVVFTRDLRVHDHPALAAAVRRAGAVVPLFVFDEALVRGTAGTCANRIGFLLESLRDLDRSLRRVGGRLAVRHGDWVAEVLAVAAGTGATVVHVSDDVTPYGARRLARLERAAATVRVEIRRHPGVTVVPPGVLVPASGREYKVFTPYHRRWQALPWRSVVARPRAVHVPDALDRGRLPALRTLTRGTRSPEQPPGGETSGRARWRRWRAGGLARYDADHDLVAVDGSSRLSPYVHFGCVSPLELARDLRDLDGGGSFTRQLCWRDFFHQVLAARPDAAHADYRPRTARWEDDPEALAAWCEGGTGYPIVDAGMRQLRREGWMHNRARLITASFLTKHLGLDWRAGAAHFMALLVDGDVANNQLNWQWVAGTGNDTNAWRMFSPKRQAERFDPHGDYVCRYIPELADLPAPAVHDPDDGQRRARGYPLPIVDHRDAVAAFRARRS